MARVKNDEVATTFESSTPTTALARKEETTMAIGTYATPSDIPAHRTFPTVKVKSPKSQNVQDPTLKDGNITIDLAYRVDNNDNVMKFVLVNLMKRLVVKNECVKPGSKDAQGRQASFLTKKAASEAGFVYSTYGRESDLSESYRGMLLVQKPEDRKGLLDSDFPIVWKGQRWALARQFLDGWNAFMMGNQLDAILNSGKLGNDMLSGNFEATPTVKEISPAKGGGKTYPLTCKLLPIRNTPEETAELKRLIEEALASRPAFAEDDPTE